MTDLIQAYAGLIIGVAFLIIAVSILPGRIKWYILSAGLAIIGYEVYIRTRNRKLLKEADIEREQLRTRVKNLDKHSIELGNTIAELNKQSELLQQQKLNLNHKKMDLEHRGSHVAEQKVQLDKDINEVTDRSDALLQEIDTNESLMDRLRNAKDSFERTEQILH